jgi:hypothetical protein
MPKKKTQLAKRKETALTKKSRRKDESEEMLDDPVEEEEEEDVPIVLTKTSADPPKKRKATALNSRKEEEKEETIETETSEELETESSEKPAKKRKGKNALTTRKAEKETETEELEMNLLTGEVRATHSQLGERLFKVGQKLRERLEASPVDDDKLGSLFDDISEKTGVERGAFEGIFGDVDEDPVTYSYFDKYGFKGTDRTYKTFESLYRNHAPGTDELLSTSSVRELLRGMVEKKDGKPPSQEVLDRVSMLTDLMSAVRVPTRYVGLITEEHQMQHPTTKDGGGLFGDEGEHSKRDQDRRQFVTNVMEQAEKDGKTAEEIVIDGLRAAIEGTLKLMMASATADDVSPHHELSEEQEQEQNSWRESLKEIHDRLSGGTGSVLGKTTQSSTAPWEGQTASLLERGVSDFRSLLPPTEFTGDTL